MNEEISEGDVLSHGLATMFVTLCPDHSVGSIRETFGENRENS